MASGVARVLGKLSVYAREEKTSQAFARVEYLAYYSK
jgi:hypothetical protein